MQQWIIRKDLESGEEMEIFRGKVGQMLLWIQLSPDEEWLEFSMQDFNENREVVGRGFYAVPSQGGDLRPLVVTSDPAKTTWMFFWGPQKKGFFYTTRASNEEEEAILWYRPTMESGQPIKISLSIPVHRDLSFHPDGMTFAYTSNSTSQSKIWALENYLPKDKNKK